jgi:hypothetical protein
MNWKIKVAAAAMAIAAAAPASAALTQSTGSAFGSLFVTVFDETLNRSYTRDLGLGGDFNPLVTTTFSVNGGDTNWTSFLSGATDTADVAGNASNASTLRWNIATTNTAFNLQNSYVTGLAGSTTSITNTGEGNLANNIDNFIAALNGNPVPGCGAAGAGVSCFTNQGGANFNGASSIWGRSMQYAVMDTTGLLSEALSFFNILRNGSGLSGNGRPATISAFDGFWSFDAANGTVTWNAAVAEVPVPAAVWLLGSGLLGLVGVGRRKKVAA